MAIRITGGGVGVIKQFNTDPSYPVTDRTNVKAKDLWVLYTQGGAGSTQGMPMGLLMALTYTTTVAGGANKYELSANTTGGIQRVEIPV